MLNLRQAQNRNNKNLIGIESKNRGFALLMMLGVILIAFTTIAVIHLSKNGNQLKQKTATLKAMTRAREAIMAYSISQMPLSPPGTLPCPDMDGDGKSDVIGGGSCTGFRGLVPFQTLGLAANTDSKGNAILYLDGTGAPIWYVVPQVGYAGPTVGLRNSSLPSVAGSSLTVFVNALGVTQSMAFVLIAPGVPINGQQPTTAPVIAPVIEFLEGENANASLATYDDLQDSSHNDQIMGMPVQAFWENVETVVLAELKSDLNSYNTQCAHFPWAAPFAVAGNDSVTNTYEGWMPIGTALPSNWGAACPAPNAAKTAPPAPPAWLTTNWSHMIYYAICKQAAPVNPPTASCINLTSSVGTAKIIVMAPGIPLAGQVRGAGAAITNFYEGTNNTVADNIFNNLRPANHTNAANDLITIVAP